MPHKNTRRRESSKKAQTRESKGRRALFCTKAFRTQLISARSKMMREDSPNARQQGPGFFQGWSEEWFPSKAPAARLCLNSPKVISLAYLIDCQQQNNKILVKISSHAQEPSIIASLQSTTHNGLAVERATPAAGRGRCECGLGRGCQTLCKPLALPRTLTARVTTVLKVGEDNFMTPSKPNTLETTQSPGPHRGA